MASDALDESEVSQLLVGTMLEGREIETVEVSGGAALVIECESSGAFEAWKVCRGLVEETQRWPIFACDWAEGSVAQRLRLGVPLPLDQKDDVAERISTVDEALTAISEPELAWEAETQWGGVSHELEQLANVAGAAPKLQEIKRTLGSETTLHDLKGWLFQWQLDHDRVVQTEADDSHIFEFEPSASYGTAIALLPSANSWESLDHLDFYGAWCATTAGIFVLRSWCERFGAEIWANYSTMLEFAVERPPNTIEEAWALALEHERFAPCTTILPGVSTLDHARALVGRDRWHLHERP